MLKKYIILLVGIFLLSSCDFLDEPAPKDSINANQGFSTVKGYNSLLIGAYNSLQNHSYRTVSFNDILADDVVWLGTFVEIKQIVSRKMDSSNDYIGAVWNDAYSSINATNIILNEAEKNIKNANKTKLNNLLGQAHFLRALNYFYLVNYFALPWGAKKDNSQLGVPIQLNPVKSSSDFVNKKRSTVKQVYNQIAKDLNEAKGKITNTVPARATEYAVLALQARIALNQRKWSKSAKLAGQIIPHFTLGSDVVTYFREELSSSSIFEIVNKPDDSPGAGGTALTAIYNPKVRKGMELTDSYRKAIKNIITSQQKERLKANNQKAIDTRITELLYSPQKPPQSINDYQSTNKYESNTTEADNNPIFRLAEMILTRAEALAEINGVNKESIDLLNKIRKRAIKVVTKEGNPGDEKFIEFQKKDFTNKQELLNAILLEERVELSYEGHRKDELQRHKLDVRGLKWDANSLVFPIPLSQMNSDSLEVQNPGY